MSPWIAFMLGVIALPFGWLLSTALLSRSEVYSRECIDCGWRWANRGLKSTHDDLAYVP